MSNNTLKTLVLYRSKTGFTKTYAEWIAQALQCDLLDAKSIALDDLEKYDTLIYGGGLYVGGIQGLKQLLKNYSKLNKKNWVIFAVGATPVREETTEELRILNLSTEQRQKIKFFYLRGGFDYHLLTPIDKVLMLLLKLKLRVVKNPTPDQRGMLASYSHPAVFTQRKQIEPLLEKVCSFTLDSQQ